MPRLIGNRVMLREFMRDDLDAMRACMDGPDMYGYMGGSYARPRTLEQAEEELSRILNGDSGGVNLVIADVDDGRYVGQCSLTRVDHLSRKAELSIAISETECDRGYGTEAVGLLLKLAFRGMNLNRVYLYVFDDNLRAIRCYEKCGFRVEGRLKQDMYREGEYRDRLAMAILRCDCGES